MLWMLFLSSGVQSSGLWDEAVSESDGFSPDAAVPPARRLQTEQFVAGVVGVFYNPEGLSS